MFPGRIRYWRFQSPPFFWIWQNSVTSSSLKKPELRNGRFDSWRPTALLSTTARIHAVCWPEWRA